MYWHWHAFIQFMCMWKCCTGIYNDSRNKIEKEQKQRCAYNKRRNAIHSWGCIAVHYEQNFLITFLSIDLFHVSPRLRLALFAYTRIGIGISILHNCGFTYIGLLMKHTLPARSGQRHKWSVLRSFCSFALASFISFNACTSLWFLFIRYAMSYSYKGTKAGRN